MADCECLPKCIFFHDKMENMPAMADIYKHRYCREDNSLCARYKVFRALGREAVPSDLFPNELDRAMHLLSAQVA
jgi:hypothetical protein